MTLDAMPPVVASQTRNSPRSIWCPTNSMANGTTLSFQPITPNRSPNFVTNPKGPPQNKRSISAPIHPGCPRCAPCDLPLVNLRSRASPSGRLGADLGPFILWRALTGGTLSRIRPADSVCRLHTRGRNHRSDKNRYSNSRRRPRRQTRPLRSGEKTPTRWTAMEVAPVAPRRRATQYR